jgi:hypothetical protein
MRVLNVARVGTVSAANWQDPQTGLVVSLILWRCLLRQQCPMKRETRIRSCSELRIMRYLVVYNFGCLIQSLDCLQLLSAIQCLECALMTHFLFISRIEAESGTQVSSPSSEVGVRAQSRQLMNLLIAPNVAVTWHPKRGIGKHYYF